MAEETASPEAPTPAPSGDAFNAAFDKAAAEQGVDSGEAETEAAAAPTETEAPAQETQEEGEPPQEASTATEEPPESPAAAAAKGPLKALYDKIPEAHRHEVQKYIDKALGRGFQANAAQRKLITAFEANPIEAAKYVLKANGVALPDEPAAKPEPALAESVEARLVSKGATPEQAKVLAPLFTEIVQDALKPVEQRLETHEAQRTAALVDADIADFKKDHPDYDELEPEMDKLMSKFMPAESMTTKEILTFFRNAVLADKSVDERVGKVTKKMVSSAKTAAAKTRPVPATTVQPGLPGGKLPSVEQAFEAASRGEVWGRGIRR